MGRGASRGDRQRCKCMDELMTLLTAVESKMDKHRLIMYAFGFNYRRKLIESGSYIGLQGP